MNLSQALEHANALVFPGFLSDDETLTAEREKNEEAIGIYFMKQKQFLVYHRH